MILPLSRSLVLSFSSVTVIIMLLYFFTEVPAEIYRDYGPQDTVTQVDLNNDRLQPGFFKLQPEWDWHIPAYPKGWRGYARIPRNRDVIMLTASDGGGHNNVIPNILQRVLEDREKYCEKHGYNHLWLNTSRYDIGEAHRVRQDILLLTVS